MAKGFELIWDQFEIVIHELHLINKKIVIDDQKISKSDISKLFLELNRLRCIIAEEESHVLPFVITNKDGVTTANDDTPINHR